MDFDRIYVMIRLYFRQLVDCSSVIFNFFIGTIFVCLLITGFMYVDVLRRKDNIGGECSASELEQQMEKLFATLLFMSIVSVGLKLLANQFL